MRISLSSLSSLASPKPQQLRQSEESVRFGNLDSGNNPDNELYTMLEAERLLAELKEKGRHRLSYEKVSEAFQEAKKGSADAMAWLGDAYHTISLASYRATWSGGRRIIKEASSDLLEAYKWYYLAANFSTGGKYEKYKTLDSMQDMAALQSFEQTTMFLSVIGEKLSSRLRQEGKARASQWLHESGLNILG